jgi:hypothetical protein
MEQGEYKMNLSDERMMILKMIEEGKISADEGAKLLASVGGETKKSTRAGVPVVADGPKWFRIRVRDTVTGKNKATVNLPISLMDWGLKVGAQFAPEVSGIDMQELAEILRSGAEGKIIEVIDEEDGEHVEIYIE